MIDFKSLATLSLNNRKRHERQYARRFVAMLFSLSLFLSISSGLWLRRCYSPHERDAKVEHSFTSLDFCFFICFSVQRVGLFVSSLSLSFSSFRLFPHFFVRFYMRRSPLLADFSFIQHLLVRPCFLFREPISENNEISLCFSNTDYCCPWKKEFCTNLCLKKYMMCV